jgi:propionyl-CoA carboxylase alpha chain
VVEEAPSPFVTPEMRRKMGEQAVALARAVGYYSAGTVELIVSGADKTGDGFYFLEMNTRLQVEHPVTEAITGLDLVEQMIRVAAGEKLAFTQDEVTLTGWAIENRVYAEDPYRGFLPSTGRLVRYAPPASQDTPYGAVGGEGYVRVDDGVAEGGEVSMFYDPMIAKLITWGNTRDEAADLQVAALDRFELDGLGNNIDFLSALMQHPRFRSGALTTGFIAEEYPEGFEGAPADAALLRKLAAVATVLDLIQAARAAEISGQLATPTLSSARVVLIGGERFDISVDGHAGGMLVNFDPDEAPLDMTTGWQPGQRLAQFRIDGEELLSVGVQRGRAGWTLRTRGAAHDAKVYAPRVAELARHMIEKIPPDMSRFLLAPMPGLLTRIEVGEGEKVEAGQPLAVVEAMKMENILRAEKAGVVKAINFAAGDSLAVDAAILEFE